MSCERAMMWESPIRGGETRVLYTTVNDGSNLRRCSGTCAFDARRRVKPLVRFNKASNISSCKGEHSCRVCQGWVPSQASLARAWTSLVWNWNDDENLGFHHWWRERIWILICMSKMSDVKRLMENEFNSNDFERALQFTAYQRQSWRNFKCPH